MKVAWHVACLIRMTTNYWRLTYLAVKQSMFCGNVKSQENPFDLSTLRAEAEEHWLFGTIDEIIVAKNWAELTLLACTYVERVV